MAACTSSPSATLGQSEPPDDKRLHISQPPRSMWAWRFPDDAARHITITAPRRVIVVGDPHGCFDEFEDLLLKCKFDATAGDAVVVVGDLVNKGPKSLEMLRFARDTEAVWSIRGNHEDNALRDWQTWKDSGKEPKEKWVMNMTEADVFYLQHLPYTCFLPQHEVLVVHAGLLPGAALENQLDGHMVRMRNLAVFKNEDVLKWVASERDGDGVPWASKWKGPPHVLFGHDAIRKLQEYKYATGLDTGCCYGFHLTACVLGPNPGKKQLLKVAARAEYEKPANKPPPSQLVTSRFISSCHLGAVVMSIFVVGIAWTMRYHRSLLLRSKLK